MTDYIIARPEKEYRTAALLFKEYAAWLNIDLKFQHFEKELQELRKMYAEPFGGIILCKIEKEFIACVAIRKIEENIAELKRMFVQPAYQHQRIGNALLEKAITLAKHLHYRSVRLDTLNYMMPAINLYKKYGFAQIEAYYNNPNTTVVYFELKINA